MDISKNDIQNLWKAAEKKKTNERSTRDRTMFKINVRCRKSVKPARSVYISEVWKLFALFISFKLLSLFLLPRFGRCNIQCSPGDICWNFEHFI